MATKASRKKGSRKIGLVVSSPKSTSDATIAPPISTTVVSTPKQKPDTVTQAAAIHEHLAAGAAQPWGAPKPVPNGNGNRLHEEHIEDDPRMEELRDIVENYNTMDCQGQTCYAYLGGKLCAGLKTKYSKHGKWTDLVKGFVQTAINDVLRSKHDVKGQSSYIQHQTIARWMRIYKNWNKIATAAKEAGYQRIPNGHDIETSKTPPKCDFGAVAALALIAKPKEDKEKELTPIQEKFLKAAAATFKAQLKNAIIDTASVRVDQMEDLVAAVKLELYWEGGKRILNATYTQDIPIIEKVLSNAFAWPLGKKSGDIISVKVD